MTEVDKDRHTLLAMAASSGNKDTFNAVLAAVKEELGQTEVNQNLNNTGWARLATNIVIFLEYHIHHIYAVEIIKETDSVGRTVLASSGDEDSFDIVLPTVTKASKNTE